MLPARLRTAIPEEPETTSGTLASVVLPDTNVTEPAGVVDPVAGFTVAVRVVCPVVRTAAGAGESIVVVATTGCVTVTVVAAAELAKLAVPVKLALMEFTPATRLDAFTVSVAEAEVPERTTGAEPRLLVPDVISTVPVGCAEPVIALTIAVNCVAPVSAIDAGLVVRVMLVPDSIELLCHLSARLYASTDPSPVTRS